MNKLANTLQKARFEIETKGLYKGQLEGPKGKDGPCCMMGALNRSTNALNRSTTDGNDRWHRAMHLLEFSVPDGNVPAFNDKPTTKKKDALKCFDAAISLALSNEV